MSMRLRKQWVDVGMVGVVAVMAVAAWVYINPMVEYPYYADVMPGYVAYQVKNYASQNMPDRARGYVYMEPGTEEVSRAYLEAFCAMVHAMEQMMHQLQLSGFPFVIHRDDQNDFLKDVRNGYGFEDMVDVPSNLRALETGGTVYVTPGQPTGIVWPVRKVKGRWKVLFGVTPAPGITQDESIDSMEDIRHRFNKIADRIEGGEIVETHRDEFVNACEQFDQLVTNTPGANLPEPFLGEYNALLEKEYEEGERRRREMLSEMETRAEQE
jgi:hypothetical protein